MSYKQSLVKLQNISQQRNNFINLLNTLDDKLSHNEIDVNQKNSIISNVTAGMEPQEYLKTLNTHIAHLENFILVEKEKRKILKKRFFTAGIVSAILFFYTIFFILGPSLTGLVTFNTGKQVMLNVSQNFTKDTINIIPLLETSDSVTGSELNMTSLKVSGKYSGAVKIIMTGDLYYIDNVTNSKIKKIIQYIVFDSSINSSTSKSGGDNSITGFVINDGQPVNTVNNDNNISINNFSDVLVEQPNITENITENISNNLSNNFTDVSINSINQSQEINSLTPLPAEDKNVSQNNTKIYTILDNACIETCNLNNELSNIKLLIELSDDGSLELDKILYVTSTINHAPVQIKNIPNITLTQNTIIINLSEYFIDPDNDNIIFDTSYVDQLKTSINNNILKLSLTNDSQNDVVSLFVYASDGKEMITSNIFNIIIKQELIPEFSANVTNTIIDTAIDTTVDTTNNIVTTPFSISKLPFTLDQKLRNEYTNSSAKPRVIIKYKSQIKGTSAASVNNYISNLKNSITESKTKNVKDYDTISLEKDLQNLQSALQNSSEPSITEQNITESNISELTNESQNNTIQNNLIQKNLAQDKSILSDKSVSSSQLFADAKKLSINALNAQIEQLNNKIENAHYAEKILNAETIPVEKAMPSIGIESVTLSIDDLELLRNNDNIDSIYLDQPVAPLLIESMNITEITRAKEYYKTTKNLLDIKDSSLNGAGIRICILDTGVNPSVVKNYRYGYDFINGDADPTDDNGHGTEIGYAIYSVAPDSDLIVAKVLDASGNGYESDVLAGLDYCEQQNANIISLSIGSGEYSGYCNDNVVAKKVNELFMNGILVVAAAGNGGHETIKAPACASRVLRVTASTKSDTIANFASYNNATLITAPGESIITKDISGNDITVSGTSMSAAITAGASALLIQNDNISSKDMPNLLIHTGYVINASARQFSRINIFNALNKFYTNNLTPGSVSNNINNSGNYTAQATYCFDWDGLPAQCNAEFCCTYDVHTDGCDGNGGICRSSTGACDPAETCAGQNIVCPADQKSPAGTRCRTDSYTCSSGACTKGRTYQNCDGSNAACPGGSYGTEYANIGTNLVCGSSNNEISPTCSIYCSATGANSCSGQSTYGYMGSCSGGSCSGSTVSTLSLGGCSYAVCNGDCNSWCSGGSCQDTTVGTDPYNICTDSGYDGCSNVCLRSRSNTGLCGSGTACASDTSPATLGMVCNGGALIPPTTLIYCSITNSCTNGACSGTKYYNSCDGTGVPGSCSSNNAASPTVYASSYKTLTTSCTDQDASGPSLSCDGSKHNFCTAGSCTGGYYRYAECNGGGTCDSSVSTYYQQYNAGASGNAYDQTVFDSTCNTVSASATLYCSVDSGGCTSNTCSATIYNRACNAFGSCRPDNSGAYSYAVYASPGASLLMTGSCQTSGGTTCSNTAHCNGETYYDNYMCNGAGACTTDNSGHDKDSGSSYCTSSASGCTARTWIGSFSSAGSTPSCCGNNGGSDSFSTFSASLTSTNTPVTCYQCNAGSYTGSNNYVGNGNATGSATGSTSLTCYYGDITCAYNSASNGASDSLCGNGYFSSSNSLCSFADKTTATSGYCYSGSMSCADNVHTKGSVSGSLTGNGYYVGSLTTSTSIDCFYGDITCTSGGGANGADSVEYGNGYLPGAGTYRTCYYGDITCADNSHGSGTTITVYGWGNYSGSLSSSTSLTCYYGGGNCGDGTHSDGTSITICGNGYFSSSNSVCSFADKTTVNQGYCYTGTMSCASGSYSNGGVSSLLFGNGNYSGSLITGFPTLTCYYGDITCASGSSGNGASITICGNGYTSSSNTVCTYADPTTATQLYCYTGDMTCNNGGFGNGAVTGLLYGNGYYTGSLTTSLSTTCYYGDQTCNEGTNQDGTNVLICGNGYLSSSNSACTSISNSSATSGYCYYGDMTCNNGAGASGTVSALLFGHGYASGTTCYSGDIQCNDGTSYNGNTCALQCSGVGTTCCTSSTNYRDTVACASTGCSYTDHERDTGSTYCTSGTGGCTAYTWLASGQGANSKCCGDDGVSDSWNQTTGAGNQCCYQGSVLNSGSSSGSFYCYNGNIYSCNSAGTFSFDIDYTTGTCTAVNGLYCNSDNTWKATLPNGCGGCSAGSSCTSLYCIEGNCQASCTGYSGSVNRCSYNSGTAYTAFGICTTQTGSGEQCDQTDASRNAPSSGTLYFQCSDTTSNYGFSCANGTLAGGYSANGVCGGGSHGNCYTGWASDSSTSITSSSVFGTTAASVCAIGNNAYYCASVAAGTFSPGNQHCDGSNTACITCSGNTKTSNGNCESGCSAPAACDEQAPNTQLSQCNGVGQNYFRDYCGSGTNCGLVDNSSVCKAVGTGCSANSACEGIKPNTTIVNCTSGGNTYFTDNCTATCTTADSGDNICRGPAYQAACTATPFCNTVAAGTTLTACTNTGTNYFADQCSAACVGQDDSSTCRGPQYQASCTAKPECNGLAPSATITNCSTAGTTYFADNCAANCAGQDRGDNICRNSTWSADCTATAFCGGQTPGTRMTSCTLTGVAYYADNCSSSCAGSDDTGICRSATYAAGCTAVSACNGLAISTDVVNCTSAGFTYFADNCGATCAGQDRGDNICRNSTFSSGCTATAFCGGQTAGSTLTSCTNTGQTYFADQCTAGCVGQDDTSLCRASNYGAGCSATLACNGLAPLAQITNCTAGGTSYFADNCSSSCAAIDRGDNICRSSSFASDCSGNASANGKAPGGCDGTSGWINSTCGYYSDGDYNQTVCNCIKGSSPTYWNLGGEISGATCCEDAADYRSTKLCAVGVCTSDSNDDACCNANNKCVNSSTCYASGTSPITVGGTGTTDYCNAGTWYDCGTSADCAPGYYCTGVNTCGLSNVTVTYQGQTPINAARQVYNSVIINVTVTSQGSTVTNCTLNWQGVNETMLTVGTGNTIQCYKNKSTTSGTTYTFKVYANNSVGQIGNESARTFLENTIPTLTALTAVPSCIKTGLVNVNTTSAADADGDTVILRAGTSSGAENLCNSTYGTPPRNCTFTVQTFWSDTATHTIYGRINDSYELSTPENSITIQTDNSGPSIPQALQPFNKSFTNNNTQYLNWSIATDSGCDGTVPQYNITIFNDNSCTTPYRYSLVATNSYTPAALPDGNYTWRVYGIDGLSNNGSFSNCTLLIVDTSRPNVTINSPTAGQWFKANFTLNYTANDTNGLTCRHYTRNGTSDPWIDGGVINCGVNLAFNITVGASGVDCSVEGLNQCGVRVFANDSAGNNYTLERNYSIDDTPPFTNASAVVQNNSAYTFGTLTNSPYVNVTLSCNDNTSGYGCNVTVYCTDTTNTCGPSTVYSGVIQIVTQGVSYIRYRSNDSLDNVETNRSQSFNIDSASPSITWIYQLPPDISSTNLFGYSLNISYNITDPTGMNDSSVRIFYKTNTSTLDGYIYVNGTFNYTGYTSTNGSNTSSNYTFRLFDSNVYPATYNYNERQMETLTKSYFSMSDGLTMIKTQLLNVSSIKQYSFLEFYANNSGGPNSIRVYYCNSSYTSGLLTSATTPCVLIGSISSTQAYNHTHGVNSFHYILPIAINITAGKIGTIQVTNTSYFILRGSFGTGAWTHAYIPNATRNGEVQTTTNLGTSWAEQNWTTDMHLHQFDGTENFWYYVCAGDSLGNYGCSSPRNDLLNLTNLAPQPPVVYNPVSNFYSGNITINYTAALSPNGYAISYYNISLVNASEAYIQTVYTNNSLNLSYIWNSISASNGNYSIRVQACDIYNQCSYGYSDNFTLDNTVPTVHLISPPNNNLSFVPSALFSCNITDNLAANNLTVYIWNSSYTLLFFNTTVINGTSGNGTWNFSFPYNGQFIWNCLGFDDASNMVWSSEGNYTINYSNAPSTVQLLYPINNNITVHERQPVLVWNQSTSQGVVRYEINITSNSVCGIGTGIYANITTPTTNYTPTKELCVDSQSGSPYYNWTVRACNPVNCGPWATTYNFSIEPWVVITLVNSSIDFGNVLLNSISNTSTGSPGPFVMENDGNVIADLINISANQSLWSAPGAGLNTKYLQMKARNSSLPNSFNYSGSMTNWANVSGTNQSVVYQLDYNQSKNQAFVDLQIQVPGAEPPGVKKTYIIFQWMQTP